MRRIYRNLTAAFVYAVGWSKDYLYVTYWQVVRFFFRTDATPYLHTDASFVLRPQIILIPGIYENWRFMKPVADYLYEQGYDIHVVKRLGYNTGSIPDMATLVAEYIKEKSLENCIIVAHSKGGLIGKFVMAHHHTGDKAVRGMVAVHTPFIGSTYAKYVPLKSVRLFVPGSKDLNTLASNLEVNRRIVSIYGSFDPHIPEGSYLEGAQNIQLDTVGHFKILNETKVLSTIAGAVNRFLP